MNASKFLVRPLAAAIGIAAFAAVPANAADVVFQEPPIQAAAPMAMPPIDTWSGPYAGVQGGYGWGRAGGPALGAMLDHSGWFGGVFLGYNMQNDMFVYGVEGDLNYTRFSGTNAAGDSLQSGFDGSIRGRAGVAVTDDILLYGTAGVAAQRLTANTVLGGAATDTKAMIGYTVGAGMDARLTDQVFGRIEYRYTQYNNRDFTTAAGPRALNDRNHRVGVGIGVKF